MGLCVGIRGLQYKTVELACHMISITPRQSTQIFGWLQTRRTLVWSDVLKHKLTLDFLLGIGFQPSVLKMLQPDPAAWVESAGASLRHARAMQPWGANPFVHFGADLGDVLAMKLSLVEMVRMGITFEQLAAQGMDERTEKLFRLDSDEWRILGRSGRRAEDN